MALFLLYVLLVNEAMKASFENTWIYGLDLEEAEIPITLQDYLHLVLQH